MYLDVPKSQPVRAAIVPKERKSMCLKIKENIIGRQGTEKRKMCYAILWLIFMYYWMAVFDVLSDQRSSTHKQYNIVLHVNNILL